MIVLIKCLKEKNYFFVIVDICTTIKWIYEIKDFYDFDDDKGIGKEKKEKEKEKKEKEKKEKEDKEKEDKEDKKRR